MVSETLKVVSSSLLGLTVGCAQCHDHKYDPIPQVDYYRLRAIFEPGFDLEHWRVPNGRLISLMTDEERAKAAEVEKEAKVVDDQRKAKEDEFIEKVLTWELEKKPEELREPLRTAYRTEAKQRTPEQLKLLKEHPTINQLSAGSLYLYDRTYGTKHEAELKKFAEQAAEIRKRKPVEEFIPAFTEMPAAAQEPPATFVFSRGDPQQPKDKVEPERTHRAHHFPSEHDPGDHARAAHHRPPPGLRAERDRWQASAHHPRACQSRVAPSLRPRHRRVARRFRPSRRPAHPSRIARLAGHGIRRRTAGA